MPAKVRRHRFPILIGPAGRILLLPLGVTENRAFADIRGNELRVQFGPIFDERFSLSEIEHVERPRWPIWAGIGPRVTLGGTVGLVGAYSNTVELQFKEPQHVRMFVVPMSCRKLILSMEDPDAFVAALESPPTEEEARAAA